MAAHLGRLDLAQMLLAHGVDVNAASGTEMGEAPLHQAALMGHCSLIVLFLEAQAQPDVVTRDGQTPLWPGSHLYFFTFIHLTRHLAAMRDRSEAVRTLLQWDADQDLADLSGLRPLQRAVQRGHLACVQLLYQPEKEPLLRWQQRSIYWAVRNGHAQVLKLLLEPLEASELQKPLLLAAHLGHRKVVELLLEATANVSQQARDGSSALSCAVSAGHLEASGLSLSRH